MDIIKENETITVRNCKVPVVNGHMRMQVDAFGKIEPSQSVRILDVNTEKDVSAQVYDNFQNNRKRFGGQRDNRDRDFGDEDFGDFSDNRGYGDNRSYNENRGGFRGGFRGGNRGYRGGNRGYRGGHRDYNNNRNENGYYQDQNQGQFNENKSYQTYSVNDNQSVGTFLSSQVGN